MPQVYRTRNGLRLRRVKPFLPPENSASRAAEVGGRRVARVRRHLVLLGVGARLSGLSVVFVLVDEVESLAAARKSAANGSEPSDAIRVVNALLTQLDALKSRPNAIVLTTSNITEAIDLAFVDRADIKCYIGPPGMRARYEILRSCVLELIRRDLVQGAEPMEFDDGVAKGCPVSLTLREAAEACDGLSGRALRKLPFLAYSTVGSTGRCSVEAYLRALVAQSAAEIADRHRLDTSTTAAA